MKITMFVSGNVRSSFSHRAVALGKELVRLGHQVTIVAPRADKYNHFKPEKIDHIAGVKIVQPFQFATTNMVFNLLPYIMGVAWRTLAWRSDLVYIYKPTPVSLVGMLAKPLRRTPAVLDMDDLGSEVMRQEGHPVYMRRIVAWCERHAARHATKIIVASTYLRDTYTRQFPAKPIYLLPNGVDSQLFDAVPAAAVSGHPKIVFLGALNRRSIVEPLIDALPTILAAKPATQVLIIGDGRELGYFQRKVSRLKLNTHVEFTGWLALTDAVRRLNFGDIGYNYMPDEVTVRAASNMKVSQYMAFGLTPLVSDVGDAAMMIDQGRAGYIATAGQSRELAQKLIEALDDKQRHRKAKIAQQLARQKFSWQRLADDLNRWLGVRKAS